MKYIGKTCYVTEYKMYHGKTKSKKRKLEVVSWMNKRCVDCGKFILNSHGERCLKCAREYEVVCKKNYKERLKELRKTLRILPSVEDM